MMRAEKDVTLRGTRLKIPAGFSVGGANPAQNHLASDERWGAASDGDKISDSLCESILATRVQRGPNGHVQRQLLGGPRDRRPKFERSESGRLSTRGQGPGTPDEVVATPELDGARRAECRSSGAPVFCAAKNQGSESPKDLLEMQQRLQKRSPSTGVATPAWRPPARGGKEPKATQPAQRKARRSPFHAVFVFARRYQHFQSFEL